MPSCRPRFIPVIAFALLVASLGALAPNAISAEPLIQELCDILRHPEVKIDAEELKRRLEDEFEDNFTTHIDSLAEGDLTYLAFELGNLPGSPWTDLIPEETTPQQQAFFRSVQELIDNETIPDHIDEAIREGKSPDRTNALRRVMNLSVEVLLGKKKPENAKATLAKLIKSLPSERIQEAHEHTEKIDREALFLSCAKKPPYQEFKLINPETKEIQTIYEPNTVQYSGANDRVSRIELIDARGRVIFESKPKKEKNSATQVDEKIVTLPVRPGAKIRVTLKDGSTFDQAYYDFHPNFPVRPLPKLSAMAINKLSGGHITSDIENFIATYSDKLDYVKLLPPQVFRIPGVYGKTFTVRAYELSFSAAPSGTKPATKTTFDTPEAAAAVEKEAVDQLGRKRIPENQGIKSKTVYLNISLPPEPRPDGSMPPWNSETEREAILPYRLYFKNPSDLNRSSTSFAMPIILKRSKNRGTPVNR
jgi:hypothetical protein